MREKWLRAGRDVLVAALLITLFYLVATALAAVFIRAYVPPDGAVVAVNWVIKCVGAFLMSAVFLHGERALFKGMAAGALAALLSMLLFAAIGGGFRVNALFLVGLIVCALLGAFGALVGVKLRRE